MPFSNPIETTLDFINNVYNLHNINPLKFTHSLQYSITARLTVKYGKIQVSKTIVRITVYHHCDYTIESISRIPACHRSY